MDKITIQFRNAVVADQGYGLYVNGKPLTDIISTALGTRAGDRTSINSDLPAFNHNCCDILIFLDPQTVSEQINIGSKSWDSVKDLEVDRLEQFKEKTEQSES